MKKKLLSICIVFTLTTSLFSQDITFIPRVTELTDTLNSEMIFEIDVTNISSVEQTVFLVRTLNDLPTNWQSSLCFEYCYPGTMDSVATTPDFGSSPLLVGETRVVSIHVLPFTNNGVAHIQVQAGTFGNRNYRVTVDLTALVNPVSVEEENTAIENYYLAQNYPNPFNPSTKINYGLERAGEVEITVYNILGNKIATLVNGIKSAGNHSVSFNASNLPAGRQGLSSGIYFYKIVANEFVQTRKMILEK